jgi:hypothetical protein
MTGGAATKEYVFYSRVPMCCVLQNFAIEVLATEHEQLERDSIMDALKKAGGANYGTGVRD